MSRKRTAKKSEVRRRYDDELKAEAVQMLLDGHSAQSIADNLGINSPGLIYR
jgi:transposase